MGSGFSDMIGIETAGTELADALKVAEANATGELRNVMLTGINYVKSFTPVISLIFVFLCLLLLVSILTLLNKMLDDLGTSQPIRKLVVLIVSSLLYIWFVGIQIAAAIKLKTISTIIIAGVAGVGLLVIVFFIGLFVYRNCFGRNPNSTSENDDDNSL